MNRHSCRTAAMFLGACCVLAPGCTGGDAKTTIRGKLLMKGQPLAISKEAQVLLQFAPVGDKPQGAYPARIKRGSPDYEVDLLPGKYMVQCRIIDENKQTVPTAPAKEYDLTKTQKVDIDITPP